MKGVVGFVFALLASLLVAMPASAIDIVSMHWSDVDKWVAQPRNQLRATLANKTIRIEVTSRAAGDLRPILGSGSLVLVTGRGGNLHWWTSKYDTVQSGRWSTMTLMEGWELPCFQFDTPNGRSECYFGGAANYREWTAGNPFALSAGAEPAFPMNSRSTLRDLARRAGL